MCGCFYCLRTFASDQVMEWVESPNETPREFDAARGTTALCPYCGIESMLGDCAGYPPSAEFLEKMKQLLVTHPRSDW